MNNSFPFQNLPQIWNLIRNFNYPIKLVWIGLDSAGKSSLIKRLKTGEFYDSMPRTMGLNVDKLFYESDSHFEIISWDLGGQIYFRENLWNDYLKGASAIIYVFDVSEQNKERIAEIKNELWKYVLSKNDIKDIPVLILANKSDKKISIESEEVLKKKFELNKVTSINLELFKVSALSGLNLDKAFIWLLNKLLNQNKEEKRA